MNVVKLELARGLGRHLRAGHPWVFRKALEHVPKIPPGSVVDLTENGKFVARGYYDPHSAIAVRVLTRDPRETVDAGFITRRVRQSLAERQSLIDLTDTDSYRLIHGEGDGLPGVIVDLYGWTPVFFGAGLLPFMAMASVFLVLRKIEPARFDLESPGR